MCILMPFRLSRLVVLNLLFLLLLLLLLLFLLCLVIENGPWKVPNVIVELYISLINPITFTSCVMGFILVFNATEANCHKHSGLKQHKIIIL